MEHQTQQPEHGSPLVRRYNVERSCIRCHERKVRCKRTKRRSRRHATGDPNLTPRLERLERLIAKIPKQSSQSTDSDHDIISGSKSVSGPSSKPIPDTRARRDASPKASPQEGLLLKDGASTRYINEMLFSSVLEKESELQSAIDTPSGTTPESRSTIMGFDGLISNPLQSAHDVSSFLPSRRQAMLLWQSYRNNVDPLIKVLHIPTLEPVIFAAINDIKHAPPDVTALLFSIYFAAVTSLGSPETHIIVGHDRQSALQTYQRGLEVSLHMASFLDLPTIRSLQAMSIYQMCRRNISGGRSGWTLNGLLIRAAQSIGLHRDGEHFKLSPFECEMRRRLWWQIISTDARVAEDHGILTGGLDSFSDTKLPANVDDSDLSPDMEVAPVSKAKWTEMTKFLVTAEMNKAIGQISRLSAVGLNNSDRATSLEQILDDVKTSIEGKYLQYCDPNIPIQRSAILLARVQIGKVEVFIRRQKLKGLSWDDSAAQAACEQTLSLACDTAEVGLEMKTNELLSNFFWLFSSFPQYHMLTYILWHLCVRPEAPGTERAWDVVNKSFDSTDAPDWPNHGRKWNVLRKLREKALDVHRSLPAKSADEGLTNPDARNLQCENTGEGTFDIAFGDGTLWDLDSCFPDCAVFNPVSDIAGWNL
ncbi:transcriptional regulator family: Fungal Specific TF [Paecilomyces variotii]|nr:transcriptional regulator family: Fungal Specific TF [Paecilomyces variotii]KAJ9276777.1 transcriptional regulator family: Fungal Specific TF [Paecilomyces variotii]KAJ9345720.1 transcriptional regulator family: Fungal Specific TF [Paecilomyces variotii]KAJ9387433.1 transcriptional regulator family: Fungal Specific TF [Paecilomyces variotii]KAJ9411667.1 transcriptional regulator family: Fungal Specific TF [Paecilomyces variotii]